MQLPLFTQFSNYIAFVRGGVESKKMVVNSNDSLFYFCLMGAACSFPFLYFLAVWEVKLILLAKWTNISFFNWSMYADKHKKYKTILWVLTSS